MAQEVDEAKEIIIRYKSGLSIKLGEDETQALLALFKSQNKDGILMGEEITMTSKLNFFKKIEDFLYKLFTGPLR